MLEAYLPARLEAEVLLGRLFHEVLLLDVERARERHEAMAAMHRIVVREQPLLFILGVVRDDDLQRVQHGHDAVGVLVEVGADFMLEHGDVDDAVCLRDTDLPAEIADGSRRVAAAAQARDGRHARIVPTAHIALFDELAQLSFARYRVREVETGELDLARARIRIKVKRVEQPVVERAVLLELERADRMRDALDGIGQRMREVVHRVDAPLIARAVMLGMCDAVDDRVAHDEIRRRHVDLRTQHLLAVGKLPRLHAREEVKVLLDAAVAVRALLARLRQRAAICLDLLSREVIDIGKPLLDQRDRKVVELVKVIRRIELAVAPAEAQPADVLLDGVDVLCILFRRIRIVKAQVAEAVVVLGQAEVQANRLGVTDVQVAIRLRWEARVDALRVLAVLEVFFDHVLNEIRRHRDLFCHLNSLLIFTLLYSAVIPSSRYLAAGSASPRTRACARFLPPCPAGLAGSG